LSPSHDRSAIALGERNEAAGRAAIGQPALRLIGEEGGDTTTKGQIAVISTHGPGIDQPGGLPRDDPRVGSARASRPGVARADRDEVTPMEVRRRHGLTMTRDRASGWKP
jgi:hypothetical protein